MPLLLLAHLLTPALHAGIATSSPHLWDEWEQWEREWNLSRKSELPSTSNPSGSVNEADFYPWTTLRPIVYSTARYRPLPDAVELPKISPGHHADPPTLISLHDMEFFNQYGLDGKEYNASFLLDTLHELKYRLGWREGMYVQPPFSRIPLLNKRKSWQEKGTFHELALKALRMTKNTPYEDLTKFTVAHLINKHLLCYLEAKRILAKAENSALGHSDRKVLRKIVGVLEETVLFGDEPYFDVQNAIKSLQSFYRTVTLQRLHKEDEWIDQQINEGLNIRYDVYGNDAPFFPKQRE
ncbi:hypothetical protein Y032_0855g2711 [Ancylostoma ceylanicum]|nr:hypothetical protein Y032_0855g2711 [Ancylostoma ceylanicum]